MAALSLASIPSNINTYERLLVWAAQCVQSSANGKQVNVTSGAASFPACQVQTGITADNSERFIVTAYLPLDADELNSADNKTWMAAQDLSEAEPHGNLLTN